MNCMTIRCCTDEESASSEEEALSDVDDSNIPNKKVIILGAGVAGISAALFLKARLYISAFLFEHDIADAEAQC